MSVTDLTQRPRAAPRPAAYRQFPTAWRFALRNQSRNRLARARRPEYAVPDSAGHRSARGATAVAGAALRVISSAGHVCTSGVAGESGHAHHQLFRGLIADRAGARLSRRGRIAWPGVSYCYWFK